jgi:FKBP-type peptidyl-prolyl cis-trans isomerase
LVPLDRMRSPFYIVFLGVALLTLAIVVRSGMMMSKHPGEPINAAMRAAMAESSPQFTTSDANEIRRLFPTAYSEPSGLLYVNRGSGAGPTPKVGDTVTAAYSGRLLDGTPFDSSSAHGGPFTFQVGVGNVIKGWDEAFLTMKKGARRTLIIPYWLGYGETGSPPMIPPRATLIFDVELVEFH